MTKAIGELGHRLKSIGFGGRDLPMPLKVVKQAHAGGEFIFVKCQGEAVPLTWDLAELRVVHVAMDGSTFERTYLARPLSITSSAEQKELIRTLYRFERISVPSSLRDGQKPEGGAA